MINLNQHKFIDSKSYDIIPDEKIIEVDPEIVEAISLLNKKGYFTVACCSGHALNLDYYKQVCDLSLLDEEEIKKNYPEYYIVDRTDKTFSLIAPRIATRVYIKFIKDYHFEVLPSGFKKEPSYDNRLLDWSKTDFDSIGKVISYYENNKRRSLNDVQKEIDEYNNLLLEWVRKLPINNERNDENE